MRQLQFKPSPAMIVALLSLFVASGGVGVAATGGTFILGQANSADATTDLGGAAPGPQLRVTNSNTGGIAIRGRRAATTGSQPAVQGDTASTSAKATGMYGQVSSSSSAGDSNGVEGWNAGAGRGVYGQSNTGTGVYGNSKTQYGVWGIGSYGVVAGGAQGGVWASTDNASGSGVYGQNTTSGRGVYGKSTSGSGVYGESTNQAGVSGSSSGFDGVYGQSTSANFAGVSGHGNRFGVWGSAGGEGIHGESGSGRGVYGQSTSGEGLYGVSSSGIALYAAHTSGSGDSPAVIGDTASTTLKATGVLGRVSATPGSSMAGYGVQGLADGGTGVFGSGVRGVEATGKSVGVYAVGSDFAGLFYGTLQVNGNISGAQNLTIKGTKDFKIDDPLAPRTKYLLHAAIESPEVLNVYSGNVVTDDRGFATVQLPAYFGAINKDFRYQLTPVGGLVLAAVVEEIHDNRFTIQTSKPHVKVSWQVTGVRNDRYMRRHPFKSVLPKKS